MGNAFKWVIISWFSIRTMGNAFCVQFGFSIRTMGNAFCVQFGHITAFSHVDCRTKINYMIVDTGTCITDTLKSYPLVVDLQHNIVSYVYLTFNQNKTTNNQLNHTNTSFFCKIRIHSLTSGRSHSQIWETKHLRPLNSCIRHLTYKKTKTGLTRKIQYKYLVTAFRKRTKRPEVIFFIFHRTEQSTDEIVQNPTWHWLLSNHKNIYFNFIYHNKYISFLNGVALISGNSYKLQ